MSTVRYYRWDDAGAPTLSGQVGSLITILRKCLVGVAGVAYGSKPSAGWSESFIGAATNIAAFRNNTSDGGSGCYARIDDNAGGAGGAMEAKLTVYAAMTDINTGVNPTESPWIRKSSSADATTRKWLVIADGLTAWVYTYNVDGGAVEGKGRDATLAGFGDYACVAPSNAYRFFAMGRPYANTVRTGPAIFDGANPYRADPGFSAPALDGISAVTEPRMMHPFYYSTANHGLGGLYTPASPHLISGDIYFQKNPVIHLATGILGRLRGLTLPYQTIIANAEAADMPGFVGHVVVKTRAGLDWTNDEMGVAVLLDSVGPWL